LTYRGTVLSRAGSEATSEDPAGRHPQECEQAAPRLAELFDVVSVSDPYPNRGRTLLVRVYAEVRLGPERGVD
jgi:hypothetical protein